MNERSFTVKSRLTPVPPGLSRGQRLVSFKWAQGAAATRHNIFPSSQLSGNIRIVLENLPRDFPPRRRYLIGVSGGRDSVTLLHLLVEAGYHNLVVCHLDHQLRGRASRTDARFVERIAKSFGLECELGSTDVRTLAKKSKLSIETAARFARFAFFAEVARRRRCPNIILAHHADDLVETALLNLFRGASPGGIAAMRQVSIHRLGKAKLKLIRPMLSVWRSEIDAYLSEHDLKYREDKTNVSLNSSRNRIRHRVLPYIEKIFGRDVRKTIWRTAVIWAEEESFLDSSVPAARVNLDVMELRNLPVALQRRAVVRWLRLKQVPNLAFDLVERIRALAEPASRISKLNLPGEKHARRRAKRIFIEG